MHRLHLACCTSTDMRGRVTITLYCGGEAGGRDNACFDYTTMFILAKAWKQTHNVCQLCKYTYERFKMKGEV